MPKPKKSNPAAPVATAAPAANDELAKAMQELDASGADAGLGDDVSLEDQLGVEDTPLDPDKDPLKGVKYTGSAEQDSKAEMSELLKAFKENARNEAQQFQDNTDSEYWCCLVFQNRDQKEAFLKAVGWFAHGDKYLDGKFVAKKMGVALPPASPRFYEEEEERKFAALPSISKKPTPKK